MVAFAGVHARNYTDLALTPYTADEFDSFEMSTIGAAAKSAV